MVIQLLHGIEEGCVCQVVWGFIQICRVIVQALRPERQRLARVSGGNLATADIAANAIEPGVEAAGVTQMAEALPGFEPRLLYDILRRRLGGAPQGKSCQKLN